MDQIKSVGGAVSYLVKYLSKEDQTMPGNFSGRYWGLLNKRHLPLVEPMMVEPDKKRALMVRRIARHKMQKDVEHSRWKRFLEKENEQFWRVGGRLFWDTLKSAKHGWKPKLDQYQELKTPRILWMYQDKQAIELGGVKYFPVAPWQRHPFSVDLIRKDVRNLPKRWKPRNNDRVRIMCDASTFMQCIERLDKPASSFRAWFTACK